MHELQNILNGATALDRAALISDWLMKLNCLPSQKEELLV